MSNPKYQEIWKLVKQHKFEIDISLYNDLICVICHKILVNASQSVCGCRYCYSCIENYLNGGEKCCPRGTDECGQMLIELARDISLDHVANKRVGQVRVNCPEYLCEFQGQLKDMSDHMDSHQIICPFVGVGCNRPKFNTTTIKDHMNDENYVHTKLLMEMVHNMQNEMEILRDNVDKKQLLIEELTQLIRKIQLENDASHAATQAAIQSVQDSAKREVNDVKNDINEKNIKCIGDFSLGINNINQKITLIEEDFAKVQRNQLSMNEFTEITTQSIQKVTADKDELRAHLRTVQISLKDNQDAMEADIQAKNDSLKKEIKFNQDNLKRELISVITQMITLIENKDTRSIDDLKWRIENMKKKVELNTKNLENHKKSQVNSINDIIQSLNNQINTLKDLKEFVGYGDESYVKQIINYVKHLFSLMFYGILNKLNI